MNGAGKSTLLDIVSGFRRPETGSVTIAGRNQRLWKLREMSRQVSHLPQSDSCRPALHRGAAGGDGKVSAYRSLV